MLHLWGFSPLMGERGGGGEGEEEEGERQEEHVRTC